MGVIAEGILRGCQGLFNPVSLGYPLSVFNKKLYSQTRRVGVEAKFPAVFIPLNPEGMGIGEGVVLFSENFEGMGMGNSKKLCA